jgi:PAS domain S-box-containing protein
MTVADLRSSPSRRLTRRLQVIALAVAGIIASFVAYELAKQSDYDRIKGVLELRAEWRARDIERRLAMAAKSAEALAIYLAADRSVTAERFHEFAQMAHDQTGFDSALYWAPWVDHSDRSSFVAAARRDSDPNYEIREIGPDDHIIPATTRAHYLPQLYEESFEDVPGISGYDLMFRNDRKSQIERVRDGGKPVASLPFSMLIGTVRKLGFIVLWPVYSTGGIPSTIDARRGAFRGSAAVRFRFDRVLPALITDTPRIVEQIDFFVGAVTGPGQHVASFKPETGNFATGDSPIPIAAESVTLQRDFTVLSQHWTLQSHFTLATISALSSSTPWMWLAFGLFSTTVLTSYAARQAEWWGKVEVAANQVDNRFQRIFNESPIGMVIATADEYRFVQVNAAFCRMLGYTAGELVGHTFDEFTVLDLHQTPPALKSVADSARTIIDKHYVSKSGKIISARVQMSRLPAMATGETLVLGLAEDVTEQRKLEEALHQSQKMEAVGQLTGGMAHDFNNLLGIIIGDLDLLQPLLERQAEAAELVEDALTAALRGADLTRRLLAFARRQPLDPTYVNVNERVTEISRMLARTLGERVQISLILGADVWPVRADAVQLEACIINLANNARDAMPNGGTLTIGTNNQRIDANYAALSPDVKIGDYVVIEISDTGFGMQKEVLTQIFEPFFTTKPTGQGTGLGLSMVFGFAKQSDGHINAYSELGIGTTFRLYLPRVVDEINISRAPSASAPRRGNGETILVVEDNVALRRVVVRQLRELDYTVTEVDGAATALEVLTQQPLALVFTDVVMPGDLDGFELARQIIARWPATKVLLTSGFPEVKVNGRFSGLVGSARLLSKPYRTDDLARVVREVLEG